MKAFYSKPLLLFCLSEESNSYVCYPLKHIRKRTSTDAHRFLSFLVRTVAEPYAHLPSFWCEMGKQTAVGGHSLFCFSLWSALSIIEPPPFGLWCSGWPSVPPSPPIYRSPPHPDPGNGPDIGGASWRLCVPLSQPETSSPS